MRTLRSSPARALVAAVLALVVALAGCDADSSGAGGVSTAEAELRYGMAPLPHPDLTLQPDVIIVGGGGDSIRSVTADGLTWRIDAHAEHARDLLPGKVMFLTGRSVGRVLDVAEVGDELLITIGPVDITEVIRDGTLDKSDVTLANPVIYPAGEPFWSDEASAAGVPAGTLGRGVPGRAAGARDDRPAQPGPQRGGGVNTKSHGYSVFGSCCVDGVGAHFSYDDGGVKLVGTVTLTSPRPAASFHLAIGAGKVTRAELTISGGFGIKVEFEAGIKDGVNHKKAFPIAADFSFPIGQIIGIPISFTVSQTLAVTTAFGAKLGTVKGSGEFLLAGSLGFGYADGSFAPRVSETFQRKSSLIDSLTGVPVGVMGILIEHGVRFTVGIGAFLFKAGVYFEVVMAYGATLGSALGAAYAHCRGVGLGVKAVFGVGYTILEPVVKVINRFLSLLKTIKVASIAPINPSGGISSSAGILKREEVIPPVAACGHPRT